MLEIEMKVLDKPLYDPESYPNVAMEDAMPHYHTNGACAVDLRASETITIPAHGVAKMGSGIAIWTAPFLDGEGSEMRDGHAAVASLIIPRSGSGSKGLVIGNLVGLIDEDYQGEIHMTLWNRTDDPITVTRGDRVAQMMFILAIKPNFHIVDEFSQSTARGEGGHGSTGAR